MIDSKPQWLINGQDTNQPIISTIREEHTTYSTDGKKTRVEDLYIKVFKSIRTSGFLKEVSGNELKVLLEIATFIGDTLEALPTEPRIAGDTGLSECTVSAAVLRLVALGVIDVVKVRGGKGRWAHNQYSFAANENFGFGKARGEKRPPHVFTTLVTTTPGQTTPGQTTPGQTTPGKTGDKEEPFLYEKNIAEKRPSPTYDDIVPPLAKGNQAKDAAPGVIGVTRKEQLAIDRVVKREQTAAAKAALDAMDGRVREALTAFLAGIANGNGSAPLLPQFVAKHSKAVNDMLQAGYTPERIGDATRWLKEKWSKGGYTVTPTNLAEHIQEWDGQSGNGSNSHASSLQSSLSLGLE